MSYPIGGKREIRTPALGTSQHIRFQVYAVRPLRYFAVSFQLVKTGTPREGLEHCTRAPGEIRTHDDRSLSLTRAVQLASMRPVRLVGMEPLEGPVMSCAQSRRGASSPTSRYMAKCVGPDPKAFTRPNSLAGNAQSYRVHTPIV